MNNSPRVLIAGAGPTGLALALWLTKKNIPVRIVDKAAAAGETSRAIAVQARTLEFYRQLGIEEEILSTGIHVREFAFWRKARRITKAFIGRPGENISPFPYLLFLPQDLHEKILIKRLSEMGVEIEREAELLDFTQDENGVTAVLRTKSGEEKMNTSYLCGCDGAHSRVRHALNVDFTGGTYSQVFYVADVMAEGEMGREGVEFAVSAKDFCIVMPVQKLGSIRLIGIVPPELEKKDSFTFTDVADSVRANTGLKVNQVNWFSSYHVHHRVADEFKVKRVFLLGDAAHIHSPAGGQGMNTGIGDAFNLAWKLAEVISGRAAETILDTYVNERRGFAKVLVASTDKAFSALASRSRLGSFWRAYLMPGFFSLMAAFQCTLRIMFRIISQTRTHYRESPLSGAGGGQRLTWLGENYDSLKSLGWQAHVYGEPQAGLSSCCKGLSLPVHEFKASALKGSYLIRPDGHIALEIRDPQCEDLRAYIRKWNLKF